MQKVEIQIRASLLDIFELFFCSISFFYRQGNKGTRQRHHEINSYTGQFLHQSRVEFKINFVLYWQFVCRTSLCFTDQETQREAFWWNQLPCGPVLTPISCTKLEIHSAHAESSIVPKQVFFLSCPGNLDMGPVYASQIKKLRKRFLVEPAPLWASSYTHLLYKAQDLFSKWKKSNGS